MHSQFWKFTNILKTIHEINYKYFCLRTDGIGSQEGKGFSKQGNEQCFKGWK